MYLVVEGIDTAGKSTQIERLGAHFSDAVVTKEPGGTALGLRIRDMVLHSEIESSTTEMLLFLADRSEHIASVVKPNREKMIISDRSVISGMAYAMVKNEFPLERLIDLNRFATQNILPDMVIILQLTPEELAFRLSQKEHDVIESRGTQYLLDIQNALIEAAKALDIPCHIIDAGLPVEEITAKITTIIKGDA